jgi:ParB family chromosome partitioning protein
MADPDNRLYERMPEEIVIEIETERLRDFHDHPFKIREDRQMKSLMESVEKYGILTPLIVRPIPEGVYEIISGHRRRFVAKLLGYRKVPVIIRVMKDDEAIIAMIDSNNQREELSISEKAFAYKMKYDAMKRRSGKQAGKTVAGSLTDYKGKRTVPCLLIDDFYSTLPFFWRLLRSVILA